MSKESQQAPTKSQQPQASTVYIYVYSVVSMTGLVSTYHDVMPLDFDFLAGQFLAFQFQAEINQQLINHLVIYL